MRAFLLLAGLCAALASPLAAQSSDLQLDGLNSKQFVSFLGPAAATITATQPAALTLHFHIADGFHINSHTPLSKLLIATQLIAIEQQGVRVTSVDFPAGQPYAFSFDPTNKLDVYSGVFTLVAKVKIVPGQHQFSAGLRYQACDHAACYPPKVLPVVVAVTAN